MYLSDLERNYHDLWNVVTNPHPDGPLRLLDVDLLYKNVVKFVPYNNREYYTVSYVWGEPNSNGTTMLSRLNPFTPNGLKVAAKVLHELGAKYVWIDALCINQASDEGGIDEKNREIPNMGKYYRNSKATVIFPYGLGLLSCLSVNPLPKWFTRGWTLQEYQMSSECVFIFSSSMRQFFGIGMIGGPLDGHVGDGYIRITQHMMPWYMRALTGQYLGESPYKAPRDMWKDMDRESGFLVEYNRENKGDVLQRSTFRDCSKKEDKIYCIMSYFNVKIDVEYGIGMYGALRNMLCAISPDDIPSLLLANWYPSDNTPEDLCSLVTFSRNTSAIWFNARNFMCKCKYTRNVGVKIKTKTVDVKMQKSCKVGEEYNYFGTINSLSTIRVVTYELEARNIRIPKYAYGVTRQIGRVKLVAVGYFQRVQSVLTGAVSYGDEWICFLVCVRIGKNIYRKIGMCCLNMKDCMGSMSDEVLILA